MKGTLQESRNLGRGRGQVRNRRGGMGRACFALLYRSVSNSRTPPKHPRVPQGASWGILGIHRQLEVAGGGGGLGWVIKGRACCTLQSPPLLPAYFWCVPGPRVPQTARKYPNSCTTRPTDSQTGPLARYRGFWDG